MDFSTRVNGCERYPKALKRKRNGASGALTIMSSADCTIFDCPQCQSERAGIIRSDPPRAKCADCGATYDIATLPPTTDPDYINPLKLGRGKDKQKRKARPGVRHRRDNGPQELEVTPVPPPSASQLGTLHLHTESLISGGPDALSSAPPMKPRSCPPDSAKRLRRDGVYRPNGFHNLQ